MVESAAAANAVATAQQGLLNEYRPNRQEPTTPTYIYSLGIMGTSPDLRHLSVPKYEIAFILFALSRQ